MSDVTPIEAQINQFKSLLSKKDLQASSVSNGNIGWHIAHSILVIIKMITAMEKSDVQAFKYKFSLLKWLMFTFKKIPRGKRKAPATVQPPEVFDTPYFDDLFSKVAEKLASYQKLPKNANLVHPAIGLINKEEALKFLFVHNKHHLSIINDIIKAS